MQVGAFSEIPEVLGAVVSLGHLSLPAPTLTVKGILSPGKGRELGTEEEGASKQLELRVQENFPLFSLMNLPGKPAVPRSEA